MNCLVSLSQCEKFFMMIIKLEQSDTACADIYDIPHYLKGKFEKIMNDALFIVTL